jgi:hypothetical protein
MKRGNEHLFSILKEILRHPAIDVKIKEDGKINLFFDGCCECDIEVKNYIDLRCDHPTEKGGVQE